MARNTQWFSLIKAFFSGLGTGSGVAWPSFGITFALLGASIGGTVSFALGATSICLFLTVSIPVVYFSYIEEQEHDLKLEEQYNHNQNKLRACIEEYIQCIYLQYSLNPNSQSFSDYFKQIIERDLQDTAEIKTYRPLHLLLHTLSQHHELLKDITPLNRKLKCECITDCIINNIPRKTLPFSQWVIPSFFSFAGTFGSLAGCSAGLSGLLSGMGIFTSFAAMPLLGWSILGAAVIFGTMVAVSAADKNQENFEIRELNSDMRKMYHQLKKATLERNLNENMIQLKDDLASATEKNEFSTKIQEKIFTTLHRHKTQDTKPSLKPMSFFHSTSDNFPLIEKEPDPAFRIH